MKALHYIAFTLLIIGGLDWFLQGVVGWELGNNLLGGQDTGVSRLIYVLVGLGAIFELVTHRGRCKVCSGSAA